MRERGQEGRRVSVTLLVTAVTYSEAEGLALKHYEKLFATGFSSPNVDKITQIKYNFVKDCITILQRSEDVIGVVFIAKMKVLFNTSEKAMTKIALVRATNIQQATDEVASYTKDYYNAEAVAVLDIKATEIHPLSSCFELDEEEEVDE